MRGKDSLEVKYLMIIRVEFSIMFKINRKRRRLLGQLRQE